MIIEVIPFDLTWLSTLIVDGCGYLIGCGVELFTELADVVAKLFIFF